MIGNYQGSSQAELALKRIVEAMVMPAGIEIKLGWPVFLPSNDKQLAVAYRRADTDYQEGQQGRLLQLQQVPFEIFLWSENENVVQLTMDALENGCNAYPLKDGVYAVRAQLEGLHDDSENAAPNEGATLAGAIQAALGDYGAAAQDKALAEVNLRLAAISALARKTGRADWTGTLNALNDLQGRLRVTPAYDITALGCRDLTAPEVWQLGLAGRVFVCAVSYGSANDDRR